MTRQTPFSFEERQQCGRFVECLHRACVVGGHSQRGLAATLGVTIGSITKYLRGDIAPLRVGLGIQAKLAQELGVTIDALHGYYLSGEYMTDVSVDAVESWIRSEAGQEDLPRVLDSLKDASTRLLGLTPAEEEPEGEPPYTWPIMELQSCGVSEKFLERMGLTKDALGRLATTGEFDDELAEAFGIACNYETAAVIEAFRERRPVA